VLYPAAYKKAESFRAATRKEASPFFCAWRDRVHGRKFGASEVCRYRPARFEATFAEWDAMAVEALADIKRGGMNAVKFFMRPVPDECGQLI
jgi:hypothetical protein